MTVVQEFEDLDQKQRAIAMAMMENANLHYIIDTQTSYALTEEEANLLFDGRYVIPRSAGPYSLKHYPRAQVVIIME